MSQWQDISYSVVVIELMDKVHPLIPNPSQGQLAAGGWFFHHLLNPLPAPSLISMPTIVR